MNKQAIVLLLFLLTLFSITASASGGAPKRPDTPGQQPRARQELTIFFSNDVRGETEPCG